MFNWREVPFFRILVPFVFGILASIYIDQPVSVFNYLLIGFGFLIGLIALVKIKFHWQSYAGGLFNLFFLLLGYQLTFYHNDWNNSNHFRTFLLEKNLVVGLVDNAPQHSERSVKVDLKVLQIGRDENDLENCSGKIALWLRNDTVSQKINYGDLLILKSSINSIKPNLNPEAFDFKRYLHFKNIHYQSFLQSNQWRLLERNKGNPVLAKAFNIRKTLIKVLKNNLKSENEFAVASALILGFKDDLSDELKNAYSSTGAMHVLAVSGLHAGLIWGIIAFLLNWVRWKHPAWRWTKTGITILGLWSFALITGASPSVLRAATMFSFLLLGMTLNRSTNIYNTLAASAFCLLLFNPYLIVEVGFQLSYFAVIGIVYFYKKIYGLWYIENRVGDYLWKLSAVAISAQLSTFPLSMFYFHQFPVYFLLSGLIVVPFAFLILGLGIILFLTDWIIPFLGAGIAKILALVIWLMNAMIFAIEHLPSGFLKGVWISDFIMILFYLLILSFVFALNSRKFKYLLISGVLIFLIVLRIGFRDIESFNQKQIVAFHINGKTHVEFVSGNKVISFGDENIGEKKLKFVSQNFHFKNKIKEVKQFYFYERDTIVDNWFLHNNLIGFYDQRIAFIEKLPSSIPEKKLRVDFIFIRNNYRKEIKELFRYYEFEKIILDGSLKDYQVLKIKKECQDNQIPVYDINRQGAFVLNLN